MTQAGFVRLVDCDLDEPLSVEAVADEWPQRVFLLNHDRAGSAARGRKNSKNSEGGRESMTTTIRPLHDRVLVRRLDDQEQMRGGIIIPDTAKEKPQQGEVIAAGEGKFREDGTRQPLDVKAGDRVLFGKYSGSEVKLDGEEYLIMREDEILGVFTTTARAKSAGK